MTSLNVSLYETVSVQIVWSLHLTTQLWNPTGSSLFRKSKRQVQIKPNTGTSLACLPWLR